MRLSNTQNMASTTKKIIFKFILFYINLNLNSYMWQWQPYETAWFSSLTFNVIAGGWI